MKSSIIAAAVQIVCLVFLTVVFSHAAKAQMSDDVQQLVARQLITFGTCQAIFENTDEDFDFELREIENGIQSLAWASGFGGDGNYVDDHELVVDTAKAVYVKTVADIKAAVLAGWSKLDPEMISNGLLGCRIQFGNLSKQ